jgi:hypothetical protein
VAALRGALKDRMDWERAYASRYFRTSYEKQNHFMPEKMDTIRQVHLQKMAYATQHSVPELPWMQTTRRVDDTSRLRKQPVYWGANSDVNPRRFHISLQEKIAFPRFSFASKTNKNLNP